MKLIILLLAVLAIANVYSKKLRNNAHDVIWNVNKKMLEKSASAFSSTKAGEFPEEGQIFEGDIMMTEKIRDMVIKQNKKASPFDAIANGQWPGARIPYVYNRLPSNSRRAVDLAIREYNEKTCIRWVPRTNERNYVDFFVGGGCYSMIGRQGGRQQISLGRGCGTKGVAIHEMMHALGWFHEQSRRDRDSYITINWANIPSGVRYNFEMYRPGQASTLNEPYDKQSVMHYGNYAFSNNGRATITSKSNRNERLGQRNGLSAIDVKQLNKYYKCNVNPTKKPTKKPQPETKDCKDRYSLCSTLARERLCTVSVTSWVRNNCKKSCNNCPVVTQSPRPQKPRCANRDKHRSCNYWVNTMRYCSGTYAVWMGQTCYQCGKCRQ